MKNLDYLREKLSYASSDNSLMSGLFALVDNLHTINGYTISATTKDNLHVGSTETGIEIAEINKFTGEVIDLARIDITLFKTEHVGLTTDEMDRIIQIGKKFWNLLTDDEQEKYYADIGTLGFVDNLFSLLRVPTEDCTQEQYEIIHYYIFDVEDSDNV